jgi:hypothetical protein
MRPCCFVPALQSMAGVGSASIGAIIAHRTPFLVTSLVLLGSSTYATVRRDGWWVNKLVTLVAGGIAFSLSARWIP